MKNGLICNSKKGTPTAIELLELANKIDLRLGTTVNYTNCPASSRVKILGQLAKAINSKIRAGDIVAYELGRMFVDAKKLIPHGQFGKWIRDNSLGSHRTANNLMHYYYVCFEKKELLLLDKAVVFIMASRNFPQKLRELIEKTVPGVYTIDSKQLLSLKIKYLQSNESMERDEVIDFLVKKNEAEVFAYWSFKWKNIITYLEKEVKYFRELLENQKADSGPNFSNNYTRHWKSTIRVLEMAINYLTLLCDGCDIEDYGIDEKTPQAQTIDLSEAFNIDDARLEKSRMKKLCPDDYLANDEVPDHVFFADIENNLCPDDFITNHEGVIS